MLDEVLLDGARPGGTLPPPLLTAEAGDRETLDKTPVGNGDHHVLLGDHVLNGEFLCRLHHLASTTVPVFLLHLSQLVLDDPQLKLLAFQYVGKLHYELTQGPKFIH